MSKKRLTKDSIANPLSDSAFFPGSAQDDVSRTDERKTKKSNGRTGKSKSKSKSKTKSKTKSKNKKKGGRPRSERPIKRHSYEFYVDQVESLNKMRLSIEVETGKRVALSALVRDALDNYLNEKGF